MKTYHAIGKDETPAPRRRIGSFIRDVRDLTDDQIARILDYQRERHLRFGEAAVALRLAERSEVLEALSQQFDYTTGYAEDDAEGELVVAVDPFDDQADAFRELRSRLLLEALGDELPSAIAVVSPQAGDGKTYVAANLAVAFSQLGERTLLIDADLRTPRLHRVLHVEHRAGLSAVLAGFIDAGEAICAVGGLANLYFMPAGALPPNPLELLQRATFATLVNGMVERFDRVVIDTAAAARGADSRAVAARCSASIVVARKSVTRMDALQGLVDALMRGPSKVAGVLMNEH